MITIILWFPSLNKKKKNSGRRNQFTQNHKCREPSQISKPSDLFISPTSLNCLPKLAHVYAKLPIPTSLPLPSFLLLVFITTQLPIHESIAVPPTLPQSLLNYHPSHSILFLFYEKTQRIKIFTLCFITLPLCFLHYCYFFISQLMMKTWASIYAS